MDYKKYEDTVFKNAMDCFNDAAPSFFGIDTVITKAAKTELQNIEINKAYTDYVFHTKEGEYLHFEFQTTNKNFDLPRFLYYDALLYYKDLRRIRTIVIYSSNIKDVKTNLNIGSIDYNIEPVYMKKYNGDKIYDKIKSKIENKVRLDKQEIMELTFLPIMKNSKNVSDRTIESIELADKLEDGREKLQCVSMLYAFLEKFGDEKSKKRLMEVFSMTEIGKMLVQKSIEEGIEKGIEKGKIEGKIEGKAEILIKQLIKKFKKVPDEYRHKILQAPSEVIDIIATDIFEIESIKDLEQYF